MNSDSTKLSKRVSRVIETVTSVMIGALLMPFIPVVNDIPARAG